MKHKYFLSILLFLAMAYGMRAQMYINELYSFGSSSNSQYIELRGTPNSFTPANTYIVTIISYNKSNGFAGRESSSLNISNLQFGANGYLLLLQNGHPYSGSYDTSPSGPNVVTPSSGTGWGNMEIGGTTTAFRFDVITSVLLVTTNVPVVDNQDYDTNDDGILDNGAQNWTIHDAFAYNYGGDDDGAGANHVDIVYGGKAYFIGPTDNLTIRQGGTTTIVTGSSFSVTYAARIGNSTGSSGSDWFMGKANDASMPLTLDNAFSTTFLGGTINTLGEDNAVALPNEYTGTGNWSNTGNWSLGSVPTSSSIVTITGTVTVDVTNAVTDDLTVDGSLTVSSGNALTVDGDLDNNGTVQMNSGSSVIVNGTSTGNVTYSRNIPTTNWYLGASPVSSQSIATLVGNHPFSIGSVVTRRGIGKYSNVTGFVYYDPSGAPNPISESNFIEGQGYAFQLLAPDDIDFTGTLSTGNVNINISKLAETHNLLGNPYTSSIAANSNADGTNNLLSINGSTGADILSEDTLWFWDGTANGGAGAYTQINQASSAKYVSPGQGFFVSAANFTSDSFSFTTNMLSHQTDNFSRSSNIRPEIRLHLEQGSNISTTEVYYINGKTADFDNGYDSSIFGGVAQDFVVYTELVGNNEGKKLGIQTLPDSNYEDMVIPVGINANDNSELRLSIEGANIPPGISVYLEDKTTNTYTNLSVANASYTFTLNSDSSIGRFYLHTTSQALSTDTIDGLAGVNAYSDANKNLRITGIHNETAQISVYNILGTEVLSTSFEGVGVNDISVATLKPGIYIVDLKTASGKFNKKVIIE